MNKTSWLNRSRTGALTMAALFCCVSGAFAADHGGDANAFRWVPFLAPFHNVVLHLPIGFVLLSCLIEATLFRKPSADGRFIQGLVHICSALAMVITVVLGLMRGAGGGYEEQTLSLHRIFGIVAGILTLLVLGAHRLAFREGARPRLQVAYRVFLAANLGVMSVAGHYGGNLTHGSDYLVAHAPEFVKKMLGENDDPAPDDGAEDTAAGADDAGLTHFRENVWPALESKCLRCHGKEKQKGGYSLADKTVAFKGGDSEIAAIVPGNPAKSLLVESIMLPEDDDYAMPPSGKEPLTDEEILAIVKWVRDGAAWPDDFP